MENNPLTGSIIACAKAAYKIENYVNNVTSSTVNATANIQSHISNTVGDAAKIVQNIQNNVNDTAKSITTNLTEAQRALKHPIRYVVSRKFNKIIPKERHFARDGYNEDGSMKNTNKSLRKWLGKKLKNLSCTKGSKD